MKHLEVIPPETGIRNIKELKKELARSYEKPSFFIKKVRQEKWEQGNAFYRIKEVERSWITTGYFLSVENKTGEIVSVTYALKKYPRRDDDLIYKNFLRSKLDPTIPNNWDELHRQKTFTFLVANTYYEEVSSHGMSEKEARRKLIDADNTLNEEGWKLTRPNRPLTPRKTLEDVLEMDGESMVGLGENHPLEERRLRQQGILERGTGYLRFCHRYD